MVISKSIHVAANGIISFLWLSSVPVCVCVFVCVCILPHLLFPFMVRNSDPSHEDQVQGKDVPSHQSFSRHHTGSPCQCRRKRYTDWKGRYNALCSPHSLLVSSACISSFFKTNKLLSLFTVDMT